MDAQTKSNDNMLIDDVQNQDNMNETVEESEHDTMDLGQSSSNQPLSGENLASSSNISSSKTPPRKTRSIRELYDTTQQQQLNFDNMGDFVLFSHADLVTFEEASEVEEWRLAMDEEINSTQRNNSRDLVDMPNGGQKPIGVKWDYKTKLNKDGELEKWKARLVVKGYKQKFGVDFKEVFEQSDCLLLSLLKKVGHYTKWMLS